MSAKRPLLRHWGFGFSRQTQTWLGIKPENAKTSVEREIRTAHGSLENAAVSFLIRSRMNSFERPKQSTKVRTQTIEAFACALVWDLKKQAVGIRRYDSPF